MSLTIELTLTRRWEIRDGAYHYIVDSDSALHARLRTLTGQVDEIQCARYYGALPAGTYRLEAVGC
ncbi:hypothetical protein HDA40_004381 [Hamadaea flava]|uniref:Uncharacterized protein n=1 Tax=Hamadaea flava TaxID=1742688 RepID=A0ABV8LF88_9ACTN|nr:hypothetical protein [Hamadaea flava]MCP2325874.1 hypothetical protein [Hamadaea flava]